MRLAVQAALVLATGCAAGAAVAQDGAALYTQHCASCHQADGAGTVGLAPPLKGSHWARLGPDRSYLPTVLVHGLSGPIKVDGGNFVGSMPSFGGALDDAAIAALANHVRKLQGAEGGFTAAEVQAARAKPGSPPQSRALRMQLLAN